MNAGRWVVRLVATVVALLTALVGTSAPPARAATPTFSDLPASTMFFTEIEWLAGRGVTQGWLEPDGTRTYRPLQAVKRDAMAAFLYRLAGRPTYQAPATSLFVDVTPGMQFYKEICWLATAGISTGWTEPNGTRTFRPLQSVNRDAMAAFLFRWSGEPEQYHNPAYPSFWDVPGTNQFFDEVQWATESGISYGWLISDDVSEFRPLQPVARDAMAAFMFRTWLKVQENTQAPQLGTLPSSFHFIGVSRLSTTLDPIRTCGPQRLLYRLGMDQLVASRMAEEGGAYENEGEEHYRSEAVLVFADVASAQLYLSEVRRASLACSGYSAYVAATARPVGAWDDAVATYGAWVDDWMPWGGESLVVRRGRSVVHVYWTAMYEPQPTSTSQESRDIAAQLLAQLP